MSNHQRFSTNRTQQQRFVPKVAASQTLNPNPTLSDSLRQQQLSSSGINSSSSGHRRTRRGGGGNFVNYLPQDEAVAAGLGAEEGGLDPVESQKVVDLLNRECSRLLKLNPKDFWRQVATDTSLHAFLESFLKFRSRWYDFPYRGVKGIVAGVIVGEHELSRRVFMIFYRLSSNREPGAKSSESLSAKDHAVILQEKKLLDLPKLLDICAIYGHENDELTQLIVTNAIKAQPLIHNSFSAAISHFINIVHAMYERCTTSVEVLYSSHDAQNDGFARLHADYLEVMDFINDAVVSMNGLVSAYKHAAVYFSCPVQTSYGSDELLKILAKLHDSLLPTLQQGFQIIFSTKKDGCQYQTTSSDMLPVSISLKMLSSRIVDFSWKLLNLCYLSEKLFEDSISLPSASKIFPAQVEDPIIRADILVQTFREINEECSTVHEGRNVNSLLQNVEKKFQLMNRLEYLGSEGWISMDNDQLQFLSRIMLVSTSNEVVQKSHLSSATIKTAEMDEDNAIIESKISQVKDLFPDYGNGFISACLEVYNHNPEEVIQRLLEGTLHKDLLSLDTSLAVIPPLTAAATATLMNKKDKGKGKLIEDTSPPSLLPQPPSSTSSSSVGRFIRKSSTDVPDSEILNSKDESAKIKAVVLESQLEYEDEYDDSFDDLGLGGVGDSGLDDLSEKVNINETSASDASRWGSRQKPQFYVKDGKNYSYKVSGSVAAANYNEASIVNQAQKELIHGLGRGGNFPLGAAQKVMEINEERYGGEHDVTENSNRKGVGRNSSRKDNNAPVKGEYDEQHQVGGRGRGRGWGRGKVMNEKSTNELNEGEDGVNEGGRGGRGRGRRGGGRSNNYRRDQAMKKHFSGLGGI